MSSATATAVALVTSVALITSHPRAAALALADGPPARRQVARSAKRQAAAERRDQVARACSSRWKTDLEEGNDTDYLGRPTGSGTAKVRCRGRCGLLVPPQDVAACVVTDEGRPLSLRDARRRGLGGELVPVCTDCRMKAPPPKRTPGQPSVSRGPVRMAEVMGAGVQRVAMERMIPVIAPGRRLEKVSAEHEGNAYEAFDLIEYPSPDEDGYDGSPMAAATTAMMVQRVKLTGDRLPVGGSVAPSLEVTEGMTRQQRAQAAADHAAAAEAYAADERLLAEAVEAVRAVSPDGSPPVAPDTSGMDADGRAAAEAAHAERVAAYKAAMHNFYESTGVNRVQGDQAWRRSRARRRPEPAGTRFLGPAI